MIPALFLFLAVEPAAIEALSRQSRAELARKDYSSAVKHADEVYGQATAETKKRPLDKEPLLPLALGASIEVKAQALAAQGQRAEAVSYLEAEKKTWLGSSIQSRIQKNLLLLSLEGKPAPALETKVFLGPKLPVTKGRPTLLFFWAHWCGDCKAEIEVLSALQARGIMVIAPTQHYGYVGGGVDASPSVETAYIERIRKQYYPSLSSPLSEENFRRFGASSTPTLVFIDEKNIVRLYHPGALSLAEILAKIRR